MKTSIIFLVIATIVLVPTLGFVFAPTPGYYNPSIKIPNIA
jgi:hypothetical protein